MRHTALWQTLAGCALVLAAASSQATVYKIENLDDVAVSVERNAENATPEDNHYTVTSEPHGGLCTLREAIYAISYQVPVGACEAGTGNDTIRLLEGESYLLTEGELPIGGRKVKFVEMTEPCAGGEGCDEEEQVVLDEDGNPLMIPVDDPENDTAISPNIRIDVFLDAFEEAEDKEKPVIEAAGNSRLFFLERGSLTLANLTLQDGDASGPGNEEPGNGGLILTRSLLNVKTGMTFSGGNAGNGGAIYLDTGADLVLDSGRFEENVASGQGGVIATSGSFDGTLVGSAFYMAGNTAAEGTIYLDGAEEDATVQMVLSNAVMTNNTGGAIKSVAPKHVTELRNMTIAFNEGVALYMDKSELDVPEDPEADPPEPESTDWVLNTVLVGNEGACGGSALDANAAPADGGATLAFTITDDLNCPAPQEQDLGLDVTDNPNEAALDVLLGLDRQPCESGCEPMPAEALGGNYPGFLPNPEPAGLDPLTPQATPSLFDRGGLDSSGVGCETIDYRGVTRGAAGGRCDVGAVEYQRANGQPDEIPMIEGQTVLADVLANDLNDTQVDCSRLSDQGLDPETDCLQIIEYPDRGRAEVVIDPDTGYPQVRYTPHGSFHGTDQFYYRVSRHAFVGGTTIGQDPFSFANMVAEPASGLTEKKSIGAQGVGMLLLLVAAGALRRRRHAGLAPVSLSVVGGAVTALDSLKEISGQAWNDGGFRQRYFVIKLILSALCLLMVGTAQAADIEVDSLSDQAIPGDGKCTLREALENAIPSPRSGDCAYGTTGEDRILLPAGDFVLREPLVVRGGSLIIEGKGAREDEDAEEDSESTLTTIRRDVSDDVGHRLFQVFGTSSNAYPTVEFKYLTLEDGYAEGEGVQGSGGVILTGGSVIFDRVILRNNHADTHGGVAYIDSNSGEEKVLTFNRAWVTGNSARAAGGVLAVQSIAEDTPPVRDNTKVAIIDSTFDGNQAEVEGGVLDAHITAGGVFVANSTFFQNTSPVGSVLNFSDMTVDADIMNSTFLNNGPGNGIELGFVENEADEPASIDVVLANSIYFDSGVCTSGTTTTTTTATILANSVYNVFSGPACAYRAESNADNVDTNDKYAGTGALASAPNDPEGSNTDFTAPYLPTNNTTDTAGVIIDAGNDDDLQSGTTSPLKCRTTDLRGISRTSGDRCDRGAYEYQQITARDDEGSNERIPDRRVLVDILDNDLPSDGADIQLLSDTEPHEFLENIFEFERASIMTSDDSEEVVGENEFFVQDTNELTRFTLSSSDPAYDGSTIDFVWRYYNEDVDGYDVRCGEPLPQRFIDANPDNFSDGDVAEDCVILYTPANDGFIPFAGAPEVDATCETDTNPVDPEDENYQWEAPRLALLYGFTDSEDVMVQPGDEASVIMTITNKAPKITGQTKASRPGESVTFKITAEDLDGDENSIKWSTLALKDKPSFSKRNLNTGAVKDVGIIFDHDARTVTYIPDSNFSPFKDSFTLTVEDNCGSTSSAATFTITYPGEQEDASAGSWGIGLFSGLLLLFWRRRRLVAA